MRGRVWGGLALGAVLIGLGLPRLGAALALLPAQPLMDALAQGQRLTPAAVRTVEAAAARSLSLHTTPEALRAQAAAHLHRNAATAAPSLARHLAAAPADPYGWARLAHARLHAGDRAGAAEAAALSLRTGPWERELIVSRLPVLAAVRGETGPTDLIDGNLALAWDLYRPALLTALPPERFWPVYWRALAGRPEALAMLAARVGLD